MLPWSSSCPPDGPLLQSPLDGDRRACSYQCMTRGDRREGRGAVGMGGWPPTSPTAVGDFEVGGIGAWLATAVVGVWVELGLFWEGSIVLLRCVGVGRY